MGGGGWAREEESFEAKSQPAYVLNEGMKIFPGCKWVYLVREDC